MSEPEGLYPSVPRPSRPWPPKIVTPPCETPRMMTLTLVLALTTLAAALYAAFRTRPVDWGPLERPLEKMERALRDEIARSRAESALVQGQELASLRATVEDRLDEVHRGLGEMQSFAAGVGDLKKILSNVKL